MVIIILTPQLQIFTFPGIDQYKDLCARQLNFNMSNWQKEPTPRDGKVSYMNEPDRDGKCLINCMMLKAGVIDENGTIQNYFISLPDPENCSNITHPDVCEMAYLIESCIRKELHLAVRI